MSNFDYLKYLNGLHPETLQFVLAVLDAPESYRVEILRQEKQLLKLDYDKLLMAFSVVLRDNLRFGNSPNLYLNDAIDVFVTRRCYLCIERFKIGEEIINTTPVLFDMHQRCLVVMRRNSLGKRGDHCQG